MIDWVTKNPIFKGILAILFIFFSWILVHVFAILGIFLAIAYPIWWVFFPQLTTCIFCRATPVGKRCPVCHIEVEARNTRPNSFKAVVLNTILLYFISTLSIATVYVEYRVLEYFNIPYKQQTAEFVIPDQKQYKIDEIFPIDIDINSEGVSINTVQADISFNPDKVEIINISTEKSFANIFIQREINNEKGYMRLTGGLGNPGYIGDSGHFATVYFLAKSAGVFEISFLPTSLVLTNDGRGTNILKSFPRSSYVIKPEYITDTERELQEVIISNKVLGITSNDSQMIFFDDEFDKVLGAEDEVEKTSIDDERMNNFFDYLHMIDLWILDFIKAILSIFIV